MSVERVPLLLVDDEEGIRTVLSALLEDMGYAVTTASGGGEALALFRTKPLPLVITDIKMPGMDGIALLKALKTLSPGVEVVMLTGHGDMDLAVSSLRFGAGDFLNKPVSDDALEVALNRATERMAMRETLRRHTEELETLVAERTRELVRSERFAAIGETAAGLAHAIKNIAGALEGTMYVLERALALNNREHLEEGWRVIRAEISRLRDLAVGMLELGRPLKPDFHPVVPGRPAAEVLELVAAKAQEAGVRLELEDEAGPAPVLMAGELVQQCLLNLVLNALESFAPRGAPPGSAPGGFPAADKGAAAPAVVLHGGADTGSGATAAPDAGKTAIPDTGSGAAPDANQHAEATPDARAGTSTALDAGADDPPLVCVRVAREQGPGGKNRLYYAVRDNGPGMPEGPGGEGECFQSGKAAGSGIGLFATRRMAHEMGAELCFTSTPGSGTEAGLWLPPEAPGPAR